MRIGIECPYVKWQSSSEVYRDRMNKLRHRVVSITGAGRGMRIHLMNPRK
jgi:hypothetical protein